MKLKVNNLAGANYYFGTGWFKNTTMINKILVFKRKR